MLPLPTMLLLVRQPGPAVPAVREHSRLVGAEQQQPSISCTTWPVIHKISQNKDAFKTGFHQARPRIKLVHERWPGPAWVCASLGGPSVQWTQVHIYMRGLRDSRSWGQCCIGARAGVGRAPSFIQRPPLSHARVTMELDSLQYSCRPTRSVEG